MSGSNCPLAAPIPILLRRPAFRYKVTGNMGQGDRVRCPSDIPHRLIPQGRDSRMSTSLAALAERIGGVVHGDGAVEITAAAAIEAANTGEITFVADRRQLGRLAECRASAAVVSPSDVDDSRLQSLPRIAVADPQAGFMQIAQILRPPRPRPARGISPQAMISPT